MTGDSGYSSEVLEGRTAGTSSRQTTFLEVNRDARDFLPDLRYTCNVRTGMKLPQPDYFEARPHGVWRLGFNAIGEKAAGTGRDSRAEGHASKEDPGMMDRTHVTGFQQVFQVGALIVALGSAVVLAGCAAKNTYRMVYSAGFSFANYNFLIVGKPNEKTGPSLYGLDIEFANLMSRYSWKVIGDKEFQALTPEQKQQTLFARLAVISSSEKDQSLLSVSFDDALTDKTVATVTTESEVDMFDAGERNEAFESLSNAIVKALERDKGLTVTETKTKAK